MALWESFKIDQYHVTVVTLESQGFPSLYAFVHLFWQDKKRATLWFHRDNTAHVWANGSHLSGGEPYYYARFSEAQFRDCVDILRNEKPVFFQWHETTLGARLATSEETVGEEELTN